jgi:hypothetical protein
MSPSIYASVHDIIWKAPKHHPPSPSVVRTTVVRKCADTSQRVLDLGYKVYRQFQGHGCILLNDG